jgi:hypothetical protein
MRFEILEPDLLSSEESQGEFTAHSEVNLF